MFELVSNLYYKLSGLEKLNCSLYEGKSALLCPSPRFVIVFWYSAFTDASIYVPILVHALLYDTDQANLATEELKRSGEEGYVVYENSFEQCEHRMSLIELVLDAMPQPSFAYAMRKV